MNNKKELYRLLNGANGDSAKYEDADVSEIEKQRILKSVKKQTKLSSRRNGRKKVPLIAAAAVVLLFLGSQTPLGQKVQAAAGSFLDTIRSSLSQVLGNENEPAPNTTLSLNQVASIGDADVKLEDMLVFDDKLLIHFLVDLDSSYDKQNFLGFSEVALSINGEPLSQETRVGFVSDLDEEHNVYSKLEIVYFHEETPFPQDIAMEIQIQNVHLTNLENLEFLPTIEGEAHFTVDTTKNDLTRHIQTYNINAPISTEEYDFVIETLSIHPVVSLLDISSENWDDEYQLIEIRGTNEDGEKVVFEPLTYKETSHTFEETYMFSEENSDITAEQFAESEVLTLQFYSAGHPEGTGAEYKAYGEPIVVELTR